MCVATSGSGIECEADLQDVYYAPDVHVRLLPLGKLEGQGWDICLKDGGMEIQDRDGDLFAVVSKVKSVYPMELTVMTPSAGIVAWMNDGVHGEPTHQYIVGRLDSVTMAATAKGVKGSEATLMTRSSAGSSIVQDGRGISNERRERNSRYGPTSKGPGSRCMCGLCYGEIDAPTAQGRPRAGERVPGTRACRHCRTYACCVSWWSGIPVRRRGRLLRRGVHETALAEIGGGGGVQSLRGGSGG